MNTLYTEILDNFRVTEQYWRAEDMPAKISLPHLKGPVIQDTMNELAPWWWLTENSL